MTADRSDPTPEPGETAEATGDAGADAEDAGFAFVSFPEAADVPTGDDGTAAGAIDDATTASAAEAIDDASGFEFGVDLRSPDERGSDTDDAADNRSVTDVLDAAWSGADGAGGDGPNGPDGDGPNGPDGDGFDSQSPSTAEVIDAWYRARDEAVGSPRCTICGTPVDTPGERCPLCGSTDTGDGPGDGTDESEHERYRLDPDGATTTRSEDGAVDEVVERLRRLERLRRDG